MTTLAKLPTEPVTLEALVKRSSFTERFREVLGAKAPAFMSSLIAVGRGMPDVEPKSIIAAAMTAAVLDLPIDKSLGFAWIVPYREGDRKFAQFQIGAKGFIQLAQRSGCYSRMNARSVNIEAFGGFDEVGEPVIHWGSIDDTKEPAGYSFAFQLTNGFRKVCYWSRKRVEAHARKYSQAFRKGSGPWTTNFNEMAIKTVIKNELSDWGILSVEFRRGLEVDQAVISEPDAQPKFPDHDDLLPLGEPTPAIGVEAEKEELSTTRTEETPSPIRAPTPAPTPPPVNQAPTKPQGESTPQQLLANFVVDECGHNFDTFRKWAHDSGMIDDAMSLTSFDDVPKRAAERCLRAKAGLSRGLTNSVLG